MTALQTQPITIRQATDLDIPWLIEQLREFAEFFGSKYSLMPDDDSIASDRLSAFVEHHPFFITERGLDRLGFIAGHLGPHLFNPDLVVLAELFWWVVPDERGSRAGVQLLHTFLQYGLANAHWIIMTLEAHSPVNPKTLERRGFHLHESNYLLEVSR